MDFAKLKSEALKLKDKAKDAGKQAAQYGASKLADSKMTLKTVEELEKFIQKSKTTTGKDSDSGKEKKFSHRVIVIFIDTKSEFFKEMLYALPVLQAKSFSQNISLRLADISMKKFDSKKYKVAGEQTLLVFENMKVSKTIKEKELIQKIVKQASLDINKSIDEA